MGMSVTCVMFTSYSTSSIQPFRRARLGNNSASTSHTHKTHTKNNCISKQLNGVRPKLRRVTLRECHIHMHRSRLHYHTWNTPNAERAFAFRMSLLSMTMGTGDMAGRACISKWDYCFVLTARTHTHTHATSKMTQLCDLNWKWKREQSWNIDNHFRQTHKQQLPCLHIQPCVQYTAPTTINAQLQLTQVPMLRVHNRHTYHTYKYDLNSMYEYDKIKSILLMAYIIKLLLLQNLNGISDTEPLKLRHSTAISAYH